MSPFVLLLAPALAAALLALVVRPYRPLVGWTNGVLSLVAVAGAVRLAAAVLAGDVPVAGPGALLRADALSALLALCVSGVAALAAWLGPGLGGDDGYDPGQARRFRIFANLFAFTMLFAVTTDNVGFMWVAIEATTITSALLIPLHASRSSIEASWKYILIGSVGIALAFAGTVIAYFDFVTLVGREAAALNWTVLRDAAPALRPEVMQLAFVFILVGYGTKAGLAPMHTWLPDAHAEAPAALSAMMSGVLLAVAVYAIVRWQAVVRIVVGPGFAEGLVALLGLLSVAIGTLSLVGQRNYKRLLAYSSIEHTGLICVGLALGPAGVFAGMLHLVNHSVAKSATFFLAGRVLHRYRTADIDGVSGLLRAMPWTGSLFAAGMLAVIGLPPFGMFVSEFALFRAGFAAGWPVLTGLVLVLLVVGFVGVITRLNRMLYGAPTAGVPVGEGGRWALVPLAGCIVLLVVLGVVLPAPIEGLLTRIVQIVAP